MKITFRECLHLIGWAIAFIWVCSGIWATLYNPNGYKQHVANLTSLSASDISGCSVSYDDCFDKCYYVFSQEDTFCDNNGGNTQKTLRCNDGTKFSKMCRNKCSGSSWKTAQCKDGTKFGEICHDECIGS